MLCEVYNAANARTLLRDLRYSPLFFYISKTVFRSASSRLGVRRTLDRIFSLKDRSALVLPYVRQVVSLDPEEVFYEKR